MIKLGHPDMMKNLLIAGSAVMFFLSTLFATVVFDKVSPNSTITPQDIELAMQVVATDQHINVYMDAALLLETSVDILNITKKGDDGQDEPGGIVDLFPVGAPATGKGVIIFKISSLEKTRMPYLANFSQLVTPMAFVKSTYTESIRSLLKFGAVGIRHFRLIVWLNALTGVGMVLLGLMIIFQNTYKETMSEFVKSILKFGSVAIKSFTAIVWLMVFTGLGMIGIGAGIVYMEMKKTPVLTVREDDDD